MTPIEFASPPSDITEFVDAFHDSEEVWFRRLDDIISGTGPSGLVDWLLNDLELLLIRVEELPTFALAERNAKWRWATLEEMKAIEENETWELIDPPPGCPSDWLEVGVQGQAGRAQRHCQAQGAPHCPRFCPARGH